MFIVLTEEIELIIMIDETENILQPYNNLKDKKNIYLFNYIKDS